MFSRLLSSGGLIALIGWFCDGLWCWGIVVLVITYLLGCLTSCEFMWVCFWDALCLVCLVDYVNSVGI